MPLVGRILLIVSLVITVTDLVVFYRLKRDVSRLDLPFVLSVIFITILPIAVILLSWHNRHWL